ncbi:hypothetical protein NC652_038918 [Populus alba x Populus x berolinensis]|nr:hypothetical protein NC652_038918 [Populus alba x Populus x berolinensis]
MPIHTRNSKNLAEKIHNDFLSPQKQNPAGKRSLVCGISHSGSGSRSAKFPFFRNNVVGVREVSTPRRSLLQDPNTNQLFNNKTSNCKSNDDGVSSSNKVKGEVETSNRRGVIIGLKASEARVSVVGICETKKLEIATADNNNRKRERAEGANKRAVEGWTKDQEMALQRAFFTAKPIPNFWKKGNYVVCFISWQNVPPAMPRHCRWLFLKVNCGLSYIPCQRVVLSFIELGVVPGKSAQDYFDKVNSDHMTLPQTFPRSRAKRINSSPLECFSISVSKLLNPSGPKNKRLSCKQKSHLAHKNVRELLQKQNQVNRDYEADLFSILEPKQNSSMQDSKLAVEISTPEHSQEKLDIVSPPVLKQVKNKALHEKYIDQLHCREAKRKAAHARAGKSVAGKENRGEINVQKIDVVRAAKNALVLDVRDAIYRLQDVQTNASSSSNFHDNGVGSDDDGGESVL